MSLFSRTPKTPAAAGNGLPPLLNQALAQAAGVPPASIRRLDPAAFQAWAGAQSALVCLEHFAPGADTPAAWFWLPLPLPEGGQDLLAALHRQVFPLLRPAGAPAGAGWYFPRVLAEGERDLALQALPPHQAVAFGEAARQACLLVTAGGLQAAAAATAPPESPDPAEQPPLALQVREPGDFHCARIFLPLTLRRADMTIRSRVRALRWRPPGSLSPEGLPLAPEPGAPEAPGRLYALRLVLDGEAAGYWLRCPAAIPPSIIATLCREGAGLLGRFSGPGLPAPELAGPAPAKPLDPRYALAELQFEVTVKRQTSLWRVLVPSALVERLHRRFCAPAELGLLGPAASAKPAGAGLPSLLALLALNRRLLEKGMRVESALPAEPSAEDIACALYDRVDALPERDLLLIVQNHLVPRGTQAVLDAFFPRGGFDPLVWQRVSKVLGEKLSLPLAQALKAGANQHSGLSAESLGELVQAARGKRLDLGPRAYQLLSITLGGMLEAAARKELDALFRAGLPGVLLARLGADQRMKALTDMVDRERLIAFLGQRDHVLTLMEAYSKNGKQRSLEDFDVLAKAWEKGDIPPRLVLASKNEAVCFIARHLALQDLASWAPADWKRYQDSLGAEELLFHLRDPGSCFADTPLLPKLAAGVSPELLDGIEAQAASRKREPGWQATPSARYNQALAEKLLASRESDVMVGGPKPAAAPKGRPRAN